MEKQLKDFTLEEIDNECKSQDCCDSCKFDFVLYGKGMFNSLDLKLDYVVKED